MSHVHSPGMCFAKTKSGYGQVVPGVAASEIELENFSRPASSASTRRFAESYSDTKTQSPKELGVGATGARILRKEKNHSQNTREQQQRQNRFLNATLQQKWARKRALDQIEVADGFSGGSFLGFFHLFFKLLGQDVFLVGFLEPGIGEFVFALLFLLFQNAGSLGQVHVGPGLCVRLVRQHRAEDRIDYQLGLAARAR